MRNRALARLLAAEAMQPPGAGAGRQVWPDYSPDAPPVHAPVEKDAVRLQVRFADKDLKEHATKTSR